MLWRLFALGVVTVLSAWVFYTSQRDFGILAAVLLTLVTYGAGVLLLRVFMRGLWDHINEY